MSISLAESATTHSVTPASGPVVDPVAAPVIAPSTVIFMFAGWAVGGLVLAFVLRCFKRNSITGPERLGESDSAWDLLIILMVGFVAGILTAAPVKALVEKFGAGDQLGDLTINAAVDLTTFIAIVLVLRFFRRGNLRRLGLSTRRIGAGLTGGAVALFVLDPLVQLTGVAVEAVYEHLHLMQAKPHKVLVFLGQSHGPWVTAFAVSLPVIVAPFTEELMYRGLLQTALGRLFKWMQMTLLPMNEGAGLGGVSQVSLGGTSRGLSGGTLSGSRWLAVISASIIFAAVHGEPAFFPPLFILALGLGYTYERTGNLWVPITCHAMFNAAQIILAAAAH